MKRAAGRRRRRWRDVEGDASGSQRDAQHAEGGKTRGEPEKDSAASHQLAARAAERASSLRSLRSTHGKITRPAAKRLDCRKRENVEALRQKVFCCLRVSSCPSGTWPTAGSLRLTRKTPRGVTLFSPRLPPGSFHVSMFAFRFSSGRRQHLCDRR